MTLSDVVGVASRLVTPQPKCGGGMMEVVRLHPKDALSDIFSFHCVMIRHKSS